MYNQIFLNPQRIAGVLYSQAEAVKVEVCVSLPETLMCVAFTPGQWGLASVPHCTFGEKDWVPWAVYGFDSVLVNAGML